MSHHGFQGLASREKPLIGKKSIIEWSIAPSTPWKTPWSAQHAFYDLTWFKTVFLTGTRWCWPIYCCNFDRGIAGGRITRRGRDNRASFCRSCVCRWARNTLYHCFFDLSDSTVRYFRWSWYSKLLEVSDPDLNFYIIHLIHRPFRLYNSSSSQWQCIRKHRPKPKQNLTL